MSELTITQSEKGFFSRRAGLFTALGLGLIILLGAFLRMYQLGAFSVGNSYYAATVQSMLTSWHNFFFASFEPGGSVSVDKPPLGFWVEAVSAYILGVNGFALALPNALAGILSIPLLFHLVKKQFGTWPGLIAALTLAVVPVSVSTERNNTIDGMLVFVLLLAVWAVWKSVESSKFRYLLLGAFLVGLGFNIKMLQAYMVLPALYALYFFGAKHGWWKRLAHLGIATVLLLVVSLSWVVIVDLTPSDSRPYVGSSTDNTELELIVGHNGLSRLVAGGMRSLNGNNAAPRLDGGQPVAAGSEGGQIRPPSPSDGQRLASQGGAAGQFPPRSADGQSSQTPPLDGRAAPSVGGQFAGPGGAGGPGGSRTSEVGSAGLLRLFSEPLVTEASWILPLALMGMLLVLIVLGWEWPLSEKHLAIVLWAGWLLPVTLYFTFTTGLFHAYYLIMLGPPLAALTGATVWALGRVVRKRHWSGWILAALLTGLTLAFELITLLNYPQYLAMVTIFSGTFWLMGISLLAVRSQDWLRKASLGMVILGLLVAPLTWSGLTTFNSNPEVGLPKAGPATNDRPQGTSVSELSPQQQVILDYLLVNTDPESYLLATVSSHEAAPFILATSRPVLTFGGFTGSDEVIDVDQLAQMVSSGELRFVLGSSDQSSKPEIYAWVRQNCSLVDVPGATKVAANQNVAFGPGQGNATLYDCGI